MLPWSWFLFRGKVRQFLTWNVITWGGARGPGVHIRACGGLFFLFLETSVQPFVCACVSVSTCVIVASVTPQLKLTRRLIATKEVEMIKWNNRWVESDLKRLTGIAINVNVNAHNVSQGKQSQDWPDSIADCWPFFRCPVEWCAVKLTFALVKLH